MMNLTKAKLNVISAVVQLLLMAMLSYVLISSHVNLYRTLQREVYAVTHNCNTVLSFCQSIPEDRIVLMIIAIYVITLIVGGVIFICNKKPTPRSRVITLVILAVIQALLIWAIWKITHLLEFV